MQESERRPAREPVVDVNFLNKARKFRLDPLT